MDIKIAINQYLSDKQHLIDIENDSINIVDNQIHTFNYRNIAQPTKEELEACYKSAMTKNNQEAINNEALKFLQDTDYKVIKSIESGIPVDKEITAARAAARASIV